MSPCWPMPPQGAPQHKQVVSCEVTAPLLWVLVCAEFCFFLQDWSLCFPPSPGRALIKSRWPARPDSLRIPSSFVGSSGWKAWRGVQDLHNSARTSLVSLSSSLWVTHPAGMGFDLIVIMPLLLPCCGFFSVFGRELFFFRGFQHPPVSGC